jgi:hypothetical protein
MCQTDQLALALDKDLGPLMQQPAAFFRFSNTSTETSAMFGYPDLQFVDTAGQLINIPIKTGLSYQINDPGARLVTLKPGQSAYFGFGWTDLNTPNGNTAGCVAAKEVRAAPPGTTSELSAPADLSSLVCPKVAGAVTAVALANAFSVAHP